VELRVYFAKEEKRAEELYRETLMSLKAPRKEGDRI